MSSFWKSHTEEFRKAALEHLKKFGHKFDGRDWLPVRHNPKNNWHLEHPESDCIVDAMSIECSVPGCQMRFDINGQSAEMDKTPRDFLLWYHCSGIAEWKGGLFIPTDTTKYPQLIERWVCEKLKILS